MQINFFHASQLSIRLEKLNDNYKMQELADLDANINARLQKLNQQSSQIVSVVVIIWTFSTDIVFNFMSFYVKIRGKKSLKNDFCP